MLLQAKKPKKGGRRFAIGDVHGRFDKLVALLEKIKLTDADIVFFLGDYIDRGKDSKKVLDLVMDLEKHGSAQCLIGNHCLMLLYAYYDNNYHTIWSQKYGQETLASFDVDHVREIDKKYILWIKSLPIAIKSNKHILSHAGIDFSLPDPFIDNGDNRTNILFRGSTLPHPTGKYRMIIGHQARDITFIQKSANTDLIYVDGGCGKKKNGNLVAYCLDDDSIFYV